MRKLYVLLVLILFFACSKRNEPTPIITPSPSITNFLPDTGAVGTIVTINGSNFSTDPSKDLIQFNGVVTTVTFATATQLKAAVPSGASSGKITINVNGQVRTSGSNFIVLTGSWIQKADFGGTGRIRAAGFSIGGKGYLIGGYSSSSGKRETDFWEYDTATNVWTKKADFPAAGREYPVAFSIGSKGYVGLGFSGASPVFELNDFWEYDSGSDQWIKKNNVPFVGRETAVSFSINGFGYVGLGTDFTYHDYYKDFWKYDPISDTWAKMTDYPGSASIQATSFSLNGKGYVGLGAGSGNSQSNEFWQFDPTTNTWTRKADFAGVARSSATAFSIGSKGYMGFGANVAAATRDIWAYDPLIDKWTKEADFPGTPRYDLVGFSIGNTGYIGTGNIGGLKDFWQFNP